MRRVLYLALSLVLVLSMTFVGCGADNTEDIRAAGDGFLKAMQDGDINGMKEYSDPSLFEEGGDLFDFNEFLNMEEMFAEEMGVETSEISDETKASLEEFSTTFLENMLKSYEIKDVSDDGDGVGTVVASVTYGFDGDKIDEIDIEAEAKEAMEKYLDEHESELVSLYSSGGESAVMSKLMNEMVDDLLDSFMDKILENGEVTEDVSLTVKNIDGKWLVTEDKTED